MALTSRSGQPGVAVILQPGTFNPVAGGGGGSVAASVAAAATVHGSLESPTVLSNAPPSTTDSFNRANNASPGTTDTGTAWQQEPFAGASGFSIASNQLKFSVGGVSGGFYCRVPVLSPNSTVQATLKTYSPSVGTINAGVCINGTMTGGIGTSGYALLVDFGNYHCVRNGVTRFSGSWVDTNLPVTMAVSVKNGVVSYSFRGSVVYSFTDASPLTGGFAGIYGDGSNMTCTWDDFSLVPNFAGTVGSALAAGSLGRLSSMAGAATGTATFVGQIAPQRGLASIVAGQATATALPIGTFAMSSTTAGLAALSVALSVSWSLGAAAAAQSTATGSLGGIFGVAGSVVGSASVVDSLVRQLSLAGTITGISSAIPSLKKLRELQAAVIDASAVVVALAVGNVLATVAGDATAAASLSFFAAIWSASLVELSGWFVGAPFILQAILVGAAYLASMNSSSESPQADGPMMQAGTNLVDLVVASAGSVSLGSDLELDAPISLS